MSFYLRFFCAIFLFSACAPTKRQPASIGHGDVIYSFFANTSFFTLNPSLVLNGPQHVGLLPIENPIQDPEYTKAVFQIFLEEAPKFVEEYRQAKVPQVYWAFMVGALTVPLHESRLLHFRKNLSNNCQQKRNDSTTISAQIEYEKNKKEPRGWYLKSLEKIQSLHMQYFRTEKPFILPDCDQIKKDLKEGEYASQLLASLGGDLGIMQINIQSHARDYLGPKNYLDVRESIKYGLKIYYRGFSGIFSRVNKETVFPCLYEDGNLAYRNLIRGAYAGPYNGGTGDSKVCRFAEEGEHRKKSDAFLRQLESIEGAFSIYHQFLSDGDLENLEIIRKNFLENKDEALKISQLMGENKTLIQAQLSKKASSVNIRAYHPTGEILGIVKKGENFSILKTSSKTPSNWTQIQTKSGLQGWVPSKYIKAQTR